MKLSNFFEKSEFRLNRLDLILPDEAGKTDWRALAYRWHSVGKKRYFGKSAASAYVSFEPIGGSRFANRQAETQYRAIFWQAVRQIMS